MTDLRRPRTLLINQFHNSTLDEDEDKPVRPGVRAAGEPALSWFCPDCGHVWISLFGTSSATHHWRCPCGHDTKEAAQAARRNNERRRAYDRAYRERRRQAAA